MKIKALKELLILALPIVFGQLGLMLIGTGDMIIAGQYSRECLAAIGLAISIINPIQISVLGLQFAISPLLAQKRGAGEDVSSYFWTVIFYSLLVGIFSLILTLLSLQVIPWLGYSENLNVLIRQYVIITSASVFGLTFYQGVKEFFQSQEKILAATIVALIAAVVNLGLNYVLVFGKYGMPELKEAGLAWASLSVRMFTAVSLFLMAYKFWKTPKKINFEFIKQCVKLGTPISISWFFEIMAFCSVTLFVGKFAEDQTAANNLALNIGSLAFMVPLSISAAVSVKVGHAFGEKSTEKINLFSQVSLFTAIFFAMMMGSVFYFFPHPIMALYTSDADVLEWAKRLLFWVACFQLFDGLQVTLAGILRGLSVSRASSIAIFIGYWIIGIPLGYYLGFHQGMEAIGFWIGLTISLAVVALMLGVILKIKMKSLLIKGIP
jgi:MATE family multidrug resistance protein